MNALGAIVRGCLVLALLLVLLGVGFVAWTEIERGWWHDQAGPLPDWYGDIRGWSGIELDDGSDWQDDSRPAQKVDRYLRRRALSLAAFETVCGALGGRSLDGAARVALDALRQAAAQPAFAAADAFVLLDPSLREFESSDDLHDAITAAREERVIAVVDELDFAAREPLRRSWFELLKDGEIAPLRYRSEREALRTLDELDAIADAAPTERDARCKALAWSPDVPRIRALFDESTELLATARITRLGLAALAYRAEQGDWPADPSMLAPCFPDGMPLDPWTGQPFGFRRTDDGFQLEPSQPGSESAWTLPSAP